jgi:hypothetical protein
MLSYTKAGPPCKTVRADLIGSDTCSAAGITTTGAAPVLALCRQLLAAGLDPDAALAVHRAGVLALRVRSLREGARLTVKTAGNGAPVFTVDAACRGAAASPVRQLPPLPSETRPEEAPWERGVQLKIQTEPAGC